MEVAGTAEAKGTAEQWELARGLLQRMESRSERQRAVQGDDIQRRSERQRAVQGDDVQRRSERQRAVQGDDIQRRSERQRAVRGDDSRTLPVAEPLAQLLPGGGLRLGTTVTVAAGVGATSLLLALLAEASGAGAWVGVIGRPELGMVAAAEAGLRLERVALIPHPGADLVAVTAALLDGLDVVAVAGAQRAGVRAADRQRLAARARQRGAVLVPIGAWPGADVTLSCTDARWTGLDGGAGRLRARQLRAGAFGRGLPPAGRSADLLLPAADGRVKLDAPRIHPAREAG